MILDFKFLNKEVKIKLDLHETFSNNVNIIPINKLSLFHFFVDSPADADALINNIEKLKIEFKTHLGNSLGEVNLGLKDFKSPLVNSK